MQTGHFEQSHKKALAVIERLKFNIQKYQQRPDANKQYIETQNEMIGILSDYTYNTADLLGRCFEFMQTEYSRGFTAGIEHQKKKQISGIDVRQSVSYKDKETLRFESLVNVRMNNPDLF